MGPAAAADDDHQRHRSSGLPARVIELQQQPADVVGFRRRCRVTGPPPPLPCHLQGPTLGTRTGHCSMVLRLDTFF